MQYEIHIPVDIPYFSFVVSYDPTTEDLDKNITVEEALLWAEAYRSQVGAPPRGESPMVDNAMRQGATTSARPYQPQPASSAPQQYVDHTLPVCPNNNSHQVKRADKPSNTRRGPAYPIKCTVCKDPNNTRWPLTVGWDNA